MAIGAPPSPMAPAAQNPRIAKSVETSINKRHFVREKLLAREQTRTARVSTSASSAPSTVSAEPDTLQGDIVTQRNGRAILAHLCVSDIQMSGLQLAAHHETYLAVNFESTCRTTRRFPTLALSADGPTSAQDETFELEVTDVSADLIVSLYSKPTPDPALPDECIGKIIVPLSRLYAKEPLYKLMSQRRNHFELDAWFEFYPLQAAETRFELAIPGVSGLRRPAASLGRLHLKLDLDVKPGYPLALCALLNPPFVPVGHMKAAERAPCPKHIRYSELRLRALIASVQVLLESVHSVRRWEHPFVSGAVLAWHVYVCLFATCWQIPALMAALFVALTVVFPYATPAEPPLIFDDQAATALAQDAEDAKAERESVQDLEVMLNTGALHAERLFNAFNWTDKLVSLCACFVVLQVGLFTSLVALMLRAFCTHCLPLHLLALVTGILIMSPALTDQFFTAVATSPKPMAEVPTKPTAVERYFNTVVQLLANLRARILDAHELVHRRIATTQEIPFVASHGEPQPLVPDLIAPPYQASSSTL